MKRCPACHAELSDGAIACPNCGGTYLPDGKFQTSWEANMAQLVAERERKVERAERFGRWGRPHTRFFLDDKAGCMLPALILVVCIVGPVILCL
ncbi:MAG TPA: zinc ribbon domain-containing protein [Thermoleophilia bacterium]